MTHSHAIRGNFSRATSPAAAHTAVPHSESLAGSVVAVLPAVYGVSLVLPATGYDWNPYEYAIIGLAFYIAGVALAAVDEYHLRNDDVEAASAYWALLGVLPYLAVRTRVLVKAERPGLALLWIGMATTFAAVIALAVLSLV